MFSVNDKSHYGSSGVCVIEEIKTMRFGRTREQYYVLKPVYQKTSVIYVPLENEALVSKMRPLLTPEEVDELIRSMPTAKTIWDEDPQTRRANFDELMKHYSCADLIVIIKSLTTHKEKRQNKGKGLHVSDETYLREAQRLLFDEFACALGIEPSQVSGYIQEKLEHSA